MLCARKYLAVKVATAPGTKTVGAQKTGGWSVVSFARKTAEIIIGATYTTCSIRIAGANVIMLTALRHLLRAATTPFYLIVRDWSVTPEGFPQRVFGFPQRGHSSPCGEGSAARAGPRGAARLRFGLEARPRPLAACHAEARLAMEAAHRCFPCGRTPPESRHPESSEGSLKAVCGRYG